MIHSELLTGPLAERRSRPVEGEQARAIELGALEQSVEIYRTLVETSPDAIMLTDLAGSFIAANERAAAMHGARSVEAFLAKGVNALDLIVEADRAKALHYMQRTIEEGSCRNLEYTLIRGDGTTFPAELNAAVIRDAEGHPKAFVGVVRDITERRQAEAEKARFEAQLRQREKLSALGVLATGVAHEVVNPVAAVMNFASLIQKEVDADSPAASFAREITAECQRVVAIVRGLLAFGRRDDQADRKAERIAAIVDATLPLLRSVLEEDSIVLEVDVPRDLPLVSCHGQAIQQVLMNLVTNARDGLNGRFPGPHPDKLLRITAETVARDGATWVRTSVADHGTGIPAEIIESIFDPFFTTKPTESGTGLGLAISHGIVAEHGGRLSVASEPGRYTRFDIDLPAL